MIDLVADYGDELFAAPSASLAEDVELAAAEPDAKRRRIDDA